ncbi:MAG: aspartate aminotransferase family protein [Clostridiales bacterium]|uniref:aspartate aminotransferase family protein n=1 Tax=Clostridium sp. N3C TaxID=1776758 RepID=UPI00092E1C71|nr:aspartate aminotransferase family protein [Clostridium sp. N3C]NLZ49005.1 aspartate aminotransferase family protein [Clostridiales bacterium]SCN23290.1 Acetylornithine aminotransferase [Clostridium sp. N3C]
MEANHVMATYKRYDITLVEGKGSKVYDINGKEYIDFIQGVAVNCLGHSNDKINDTITKQSRKLTHISNYFWNEYNTQLADLLCNNSCLDKVFFCNSGAEAVEGSLKVARKYGKIKGGENKNIVLYMNKSFHGRTLGSLSVTGQIKYQKDYLPLLPAVKEVAFNDIQSLKDNFNENVCAVIIEPIQGEGGVNVANKEFLQAARDLCDKYDALLIFDEIQCGIGRLGTLFAYESFGVEPDVVAIAKALGGGFPIGAFLTNERASVLSYGDHGSTYGGNPLACAVATTVIKELTEGGVIASVKEQSQYLVNRLKELKDKYNYITEIRGMGLLLGIKIKENPSVFINKCIDKGLLLITAGSDVIRLLPPLNVSKQDIDSAIEIMEAVIKES